MEKRLGSSAGILALLAVLVHTFGNNGAEHASSSQIGKESTHSSNAAAGLKNASPARQGPWTATQQYFHREPNWRGVDFSSCVSLPLDACSGKMLSELYGLPESFATKKLRALIATVPDPLHTRMAVETDRYLDAIQQAAFRSDWELATQWLPWTVKAASVQSADSGDSLAGSFERETLPGLLVFRPHFKSFEDTQRLLLVFVVGETPTAGLNGFQFEAASQTIARLGSDRPNELFIAGPNFSGSFLSFTHLLEEQPGSMHFELRSGAVSNSDYARAMLVELQAHGFKIDALGEGHPSITFHASTLASVSFHNHFLRVITKLGLDVKQAAELTEDETGFSYTDPKQHRRNGDEPQIYRYPRDIAQLRNTYNDTAFAGAPQADTKATPAVDFSLKDTQAGEDVFPMFSTSHTAVVQNAELQQIVNDISRKSIRLVSLSASNVFDTLFLANVLTQNCPDTRIVLRGADLLFVQEAAQGSLSGVMAISPFPLFSEGAESSRLNMAETGPADFTKFSTSDQIGEFNAVLSLLDSSPTPNPNRVPLVPSEGSFSSAWFLVLGPKGWLPVDVFGQTNEKLRLKNKDELWFDPKDALPQGKNPVSGVLRAGLGWTTLCMLAAFFSFAFSGRLFYLKAHPRKLVWSALCLSDLDLPERKQGISRILHWRYVCMLSCFAALALVNGLLLAPMLVAGLRYAESAGRMVEVLVASAFATTLGIFLYLAFLIPVRVCPEGAPPVRPAPAPRSWLSMIVRIGVLPLALAAVFVWWGCCDNGVPGYMLCFRTLTLATPVCPIWPLLLASWGLFVLAYFHLRRFTWGDRRQPRLEASVFDAALCNEFANLKERLERGLLGPFRVTSRSGLLLLALAAAAFVVTVFTLFPAESLGSFEPARFSNLLIAFFVPLAILTLTTFMRFGLCWNLLRAFLVSLNSVVLGRYFMRIPEFGGSGPVWIREVKLMSLATALNSSIALHNLELVQHTPDAYTQRYFQVLRNFLSSDGSRLDFMRAYEQFRTMAGRIATELGTNILPAYWRDNELPFVGTVGVSESPSEAAPKKAEPGVGEAIDAAAKRKEGQSRNGVAVVGRIKSLIFGSAALLTHVAPESDEANAVSGEAYEQAARYIAFQYSIYVGYVLHQLQNLLLCSTVCFVLLVAALNSFSFQAPQVIFHFLTAALVIAGCGVLLVFAQMERDPILSRLSGTAEGELGKDFYVRALSYGALPILTVLGAQFPAISRYIAAWIQPASAALR